MPLPANTNVSGNGEVAKTTSFGVIKNHPDNSGVVLLFAKWLWMFGTGGSVYLLMELLYRGYTHISMFFAGGLSAALIFLFCCAGGMRRAGRFLRCAVGSAVITAVEFCTGVVVNLCLHLRVWDYSRMPLNLLGQVCLPFSAVWFFLALPIIALGDMLNRSDGQLWPSSASTKRRKSDAPFSSGR